MNYTDNEHWKDIFGYNGMYQVSDLGRVRSKHSGEWKVLSPGKTKDGYLQVDLCKDGKRHRFLVHRLVADAFIPNDDESKIYINHRDECKHNNRVSNLEWCSAQYNMTYNDLHNRRKQPKRSKVKDLYNPNITYKQNIELFRANGIDCSTVTLWKLRRDLGLIK